MIVRAPMRSMSSCVMTEMMDGAAVMRSGFLEAVTTTGISSNRGNSDGATVFASNAGSSCAASEKSPLSAVSQIPSSSSAQP